MSVFSALTMRRPPPSSVRAGAEVTNPHSSDAHAETVAAGSDDPSAAKLGNSHAARAEETTCAEDRVSAPSVRVTHQRSVLSKPPPAARRKRTSPAYDSPDRVVDGGVRGTIRISHEATRSRAAPTPTAAISSAVNPGRDVGTPHVHCPPGPKTASAPPAVPPGAHANEIGDGSRPNPAAEKRERPASTLAEVAAAVMSTAAAFTTRKSIAYAFAISE